MDLEKIKVNIKIDSWDFVQSLSEDEKKDLITALSCENDIIKNVTDQLIHGCTEDGSHGSMGSASSTSSPLDKAKHEIAINSHKVAKRKIEGLERELKSSKELANEGWDKYHQLAKKVGY